ncbi:hypothetical protein EB796_008513 [Bugula neritina]|uniref:Uncharacterized protein n=1 Tax=Bugula neritina TaxID=10212 RepID=A0A7J7K6J3_BUGNE|nr:hypothetical protein EB796_008513 [Bugula neritina]
MAVLLMDCEGEDHLSGNTNVDNLVTFISLQISSVQLINVEKHVGLSDVKRLNLCLKNVAIFQDDESLDEESLFKSLVFVARNYNQGRLCGEDSGVFDKLQKNPQENSVAIIEGIKSSFKIITRFKFSYPRSTIDGATAETYDWNLKGRKL